MIPRLNLGCGLFYKPGYLNLDINSQTVADLICDIEYLPFKSYTIENIEALNIIEHFDVIHLPYLLAEWFRVLKSQGKIAIETPHLSKSVSKLRFRSHESQKKTLRYLFGIDLPGNSHKCVFRPSYLKKLLKSTGFIELKRDKPVSFTTEKSIRIEAVKPLSAEKMSKTIFITQFRSKILSAFPSLNTLLLESVENNCIHILEVYLSRTTQEYFKLDVIAKFCARFAILHPRVAKAFLSLFPSKTTQSMNVKFLGFLLEHDSPTLFFNNWIHWRKPLDELTISVLRFYQHWTRRLSASLLNESEAEENYHYFLAQGKKKVEFFSPEHVNFYSLKYTNLGLQAFFRHKYPEAVDLFNQAIRLNPMNSLAYWNLARIEIKLRLSLQKIKQRYHNAIKTAVNKTQKQLISKELLLVLDGQTNLINPIPIQFRD